MTRVLPHDFWDQLSENDTVALNSSNEILDKLSASEVLLRGYTQLSVFAQRLKRNMWLRILLPAEGFPVAIFATSIVGPTKRPNAAQLFIDYLFSSEGQNYLNTELLGGYSTRL